MTRRLLGDESVDQLGLPASPQRSVLPVLVGVIRSLERLRERVPGGTTAAYRLGERALRASQKLAEELVAGAP